MDRVDPFYFRTYYVFLRFRAITILYQFFEIVISSLFPVIFFRQEFFHVKSVCLLFVLYFVFVIDFVTSGIRAKLVRFVFVNGIHEVRYSTFGSQHKIFVVAGQDAGSARANRSG